MSDVNSDRPRPPHSSSSSTPNSGSNDGSNEMGTKRSTQKRRKSSTKSNAPSTSTEKKKAASKPRPRKRPRRDGANSSRHNQRNKRSIPWETIAFAAFGVAALVAIGFGVFVLGPGPGTEKPVEFEWKNGQSTQQVATHLAELGLVRSAWLMNVYMKIAADFHDIETGTHLVQGNMSPRTLVRRLERRPGAATVKVLIPEGFDKFDVAKRLEKQAICSQKAFLEQTTNPALLGELRLTAPDVEGYLFPATYQFVRNQSPKSVVRRMVNEATKRYAQVFDEHAQALAKLETDFGWSRHSAIILASIIEKEAAVADERPIISSVFLNRMYSPTFRPKQHLQSDPTARYGCLLEPRQAPTCAEKNGVVTSVTAAMVRDAQNRYNTYAHPGLTPGPICNPSVSSLRAVFAPATTNYLYFVATGGGRHKFSETYNEHRDAIPRKQTQSNAH